MNGVNGINGLHVIRIVNKVYEYKDVQTMKNLTESFLDISGKITLKIYFISFYEIFNDIISY